MPCGIDLSTEATAQSLIQHLFQVHKPVKCYRLGTNFNSHYVLVEMDGTTLEFAQSIWAAKRLPLANVSPFIM